MTPDRVRTSMRNGYLIHVDRSTSAHPRLRRKATFRSAVDFEHALRAAREELEDGVVAIAFTLRSLDRCIQYGSTLRLSNRRPAPLLSRWIAEECDAILATRRAQDASRIAVAKVMRFVAVVLSSERPRLRHAEPLTRIGRLLPAVGGARTAGSQP